MKRTLITPKVTDFPSEFHSLISSCDIYDSSCSREARVWFIDKDGGYYLKTSQKGSLSREAELTRYFAKKGLGANVLEYISNDKDWLLTSRVAGEDGTYKTYLDDPKRLCDTIAERLRILHETDPSDCPVDRTAEYFVGAERNYEIGAFDASYAYKGDIFKTPREAWKVIEQGRALLKSDTLIHGDYCLPNIMLDDWKFSGFIDLGNGGRGDRHIDIFWGAWTLEFNLKTDEYRQRFFDAYGRDKIEEEKLRLIAAAEVFG
jgi:kanamycin kinase